METRFGRQPAHAIIHRRGLTFRDVARSLQTPYSHVIFALTGRVYPKARFVARLAELLELPPEDLFTEDARDLGARWTRRSA